MDKRSSKRGYGPRSISLLLSSSLLLVVLIASPAFAVTGGPVILMGIDAEDGGPGGHGPISVYSDVVNNGILPNVTNGGSGILVIGAGKNPGDNVTSFWDHLTTPESKTYVNGAAAIASQTFDGFKMIAVVSDEFNTFFGGLTVAEHDALSARQADVANFVNAGGGLLGFSSDFANPYGYVAGLGAFTFATGLGYADITPTPAGTAVGITNALDICCWHDEFLTFPSFLQVLATNNDPFGGTVGNAAALGGQNVIIPAGIELAPPTSTNPAGTSHTVTATVKDGQNNPLSGVLVEFSVVSGPNSGEASDPNTQECSPNSDCTTDANGQVAWTYTSNGQTGQDEIQACFTDSQTGSEQCASATKDWLDSTPPVGGCAPTTNPAGKNVPKAGNNPASGQNPDGFYELTATDNVDPDPQVFLRDTGSGTVFGPFDSGTRIKYTEANGAAPGQKPMGSGNDAVAWHITGTGDAEVFAVDAAGNESDPAVPCRVPPAPK